MTLEKIMGKYRNLLVSPRDFKEIIKNTSVLTC